MRHTTVVQRVRELVKAELLRRGLAAPDAEMSETLLVRDGHYCGRRFEIGDANAVWFCEENQLKIYGTQGKVVEVIRNFDVPPQPQTLADAA